MKIDDSLAQNCYYFLIGSGPVTPANRPTFTEDKLLVFKISDQVLPFLNLSVFDETVYGRLQVIEAVPDIPFD